jgi:hypothetical protein
MKLNRLEAHDRLQHLQKDQSDNIAKGLEDCLTKNPLSQRLFDKANYLYIFAHPRTADDGVNKVMYWQPRLTRPEPQSNSYLFRRKKGEEAIEICWMIPDETQWDQFKKGNVTENPIAEWSIRMFKENKAALAARLPEDYTDEKIYRIYLHIKNENSAMSIGLII